MSERRHESEFGPWTRVVPTPTGVRSMLVIGAWLGLTTLFLFGSVVLLGIVVTTMERSHRLLSAVIALVGIVSACGVAPTLARVVVVAAVDRLESAVGRAVDPEPEDWRIRSCETDERERCRSPKGCCQ